MRRARTVGGAITVADATPEEIRQAGMDALLRALGPVGMIRFLQQFETGRGDYTAERQRRQDRDGPSAPGEVVALAEEIRREQEAGRLEPVGPDTQVLRPGQRVG